MVWSGQIILRFSLVSYLWVCVCRVLHTLIHIQCRNGGAIFEVDVGKIGETIVQNSSKTLHKSRLGRDLFMMC